MYKNTPLRILNSNIRFTNTKTTIMKAGKPKNESKTGEQLIVDAIVRLERKIDSIHSHVNVNKEYLTTREAYAYLGCSRSFLGNLTRAGKIKRVKLESGRQYYATAELKTFLNNPAAIAETI